MESGKIIKDSSATVDELLTMVGEYGLFQKALNGLFCAMMVPNIFPIMLIYFCSVQPPWRCIHNSTICLSNNTFESRNRTRCLLPRSEWEYTKPRDFSIITQYDIGCYDDWFLGLPTSIFFFGWMLGAGVMGWCADNFGGKRIIYISSICINFTGLITAFMPTIYAVIAIRFITGFCMQGSLIQMSVLVSEMVGNKYRTFANTIYYMSATLGLSILALKAYFIQSWKILYLACTIPYVLLFFTYPFVPESVRFLRIKGRTDEAMTVFHTIAKWNKTELPSTVKLFPIKSTSAAHKPNPMDLFRNRKIATKTLILGFATLVSSLTFYNLYLGAANISGHMYRDYVIVTVIDFPMSIVINHILEKYGRKKSSMALILIGSCMCIALGFTPRTRKMNILRIVLAMIGKCCIGASIVALSIWSLELYATNIRGEGLAFLQVANKIGATSAIWIENELMKIYDGSSSLLTGALSLIVFFLLKFLPEMQGVATQDVEETTTKNSVDVSDDVTISPSILEINVVSYANAIEDTD